jgi:hypothetical protein
MSNMEYEWCFYLQGYEPLYLASTLELCAIAHYYDDDQLMEKMNWFCEN